METVVRAGQRDRFESLVSGWTNLHQIHKRGEVIILVKAVAAAIAPIQDMVNKPTS